MSLPDSAIPPPFIRQFAGSFARVVADEYAGNPIGELTVWLQMALRREASVGQVYGVRNLERRLAHVNGPPELVRLVRTTFSNIWAQEMAHAAYLESILRAVVRPKRFFPWLMARADALMGGVEGQLLSARTSPGLRQQLKASLMLVAGQCVREVPEFMHGLSALPFRDFCLLNAELEVTAIHGYQRMLVLLKELDGRGFPGETTLEQDITRFVLDEQFHNETFLAMDAWFAPPARSTGTWLKAEQVPMTPRLTVQACQAELAGIRDRVYGAPPAQALPRPAAMGTSARRGGRPVNGHGGAGSGQAGPGTPPGGKSGAA